MRGKTRGFFEDTVIILVFSGTIYGAYYLYDNASNGSVLLAESVNLEKKEIEKNNFFERNYTLVKNIFDEILPLFKDEVTVKNAYLLDEKISGTVERVDETAILEEKFSLVKKDTEEVKIIEEKTPLLVEDIEESHKIEEKISSVVKDEEKTQIIEDQILEKEIPLVVKTTEESKIVKSQDIKNEKNVDKNALRIFLRQLKFDIASNIDKTYSFNSNESQKLKIRITVLKDGNYEGLHFVDGNKKLFDKNKENILKVFPLNISDSIINEFPRYVRISIK